MPLWGQLAFGLGLILFVFWLSFKSSPFISAWYKQDSNFYDTAAVALNQLQILPSAPTLFIFWEKNCEVCLDNIRLASRFPGPLRVFGIHLSATQAETVDIHRLWFKEASIGSQLLIDRNDFLKTNFKVRSVPDTFLVLPKQKEVWNFYGPMESGLRQLESLVASE